MNCHMLIVKHVDCVAHHECGWLVLDNSAAGCGCCLVCCRLLSCVQKPKSRLKLTMKLRTCVSVRAMGVRVRVGVHVCWPMNQAAPKDTARVLD